MLKIMIQTSFMFILLVLSGCSSDDTNDEIIFPPGTTGSLLRYNLGTTISPSGNLANSLEDDFIEYYSNDSHGELRAFHLAWRDSLVDSGQIPVSATDFMQQKRKFGFTPVVGFGWTNGAGEPTNDASGEDFLTSDSEPANNTWSNAETRQDFKDMVQAFAQQYRPNYLFLGNETNSYFVLPATSQQNWDDWVSLFEECYEAIKQVSPNTIVYTTFQLEKMKGLGIKTGATFAEHFNLIDNHTANGKIDAIGFTTYPYLEYDDPADIPDDYYSELTEKVAGNDVIYSEIGWLATNAVVPYNGSEMLQADFVTRFFELNQTVSMENAVWLFLYDFTDYTGIEAFTDIGLRNNDGSVIRSADFLWQTMAKERP